MSLRRKFYSDVENYLAETTVKGFYKKMYPEVFRWSYVANSET